MNCDTDEIAYAGILTLILAFFLGFAIGAIEIALGYDTFSWDSLAHRLIGSLLAWLPVWYALLVVVSIDKGKGH